MTGYTLYHYLCQQLEIDKDRDTLSPAAYDRLRPSQQLARNEELWDRVTAAQDRLRAAYIETQVVRNAWGSF